VNLPPPIVAKVRDAIAHLDESFDWGRLGRQHDAIPLLLTIGSMTFLRSDGTFLAFEGDPLPERLILESHDIDTVALAWGLGRYPWLSALFPLRPAGTQECATCAGTGILGEVSHRDSYMPCVSCSALGWVSAG
jgi:hypothetical protein